MSDVTIIPTPDDDRERQGVHAVLCFPQTG